MCRILFCCLFSTIAASVTAQGSSCDSDPSSTQPQGVHLAYAGTTSMAVSFFSCAAPPQGQLPSVLLKQVVQMPTGSAHTAVLTSSLKDPANTTGTTICRGGRCFHIIKLSGRQAGTQYHYQCQLGEARSAIFSFTTSSADHSTRWVAAVVGDMGVNKSAATISTLITRSWKYNMTLHVGDVSYADDYKWTPEPSSGRSYNGVYDLFQVEIEPLAARMPYMVCPGNHDVTCHVTMDLGCPDALRNFSAIRYRFRMPAAESGAATTPQGAPWYSWKVGHVHFVSIDTESDFEGAPTTPHTFLGGGAGGGFGDQLSWLEKDLAAANADPSVRWIVAMGHRPWYASKTADWPPGAPKRVQAAFEPLFDKYRVDLYLCGHKHYYERAVAATQGQPKAGAPVQVVNGAAGNNEGVDKGKGAGGLIVSANYEDAGFGELEQLNGTAIEWRYLLSKDTSVFDKLVLPCQPHRCPKEVRP